MRLRLITAATVAAALAPAAPASATVVEVGRTDAKPTCPENPCLAVSRTTGYQARIAGSATDFVFPSRGRIVAWSITLGKPTADQVSFFDKNLGGPSRARITVLRTGKRRFARVVAQGPVVRLSRFFGQTVQFPLRESLPVRKGYVLGLTVPTWAPALTPLMSDGSKWRASRPARRCSDTGTQRAQSDPGDLAQYLCTYQARLSYSATLVTRPVPSPKGERGG